MVQNKDIFRIPNYSKTKLYTKCLEVCRTEMRLKQTRQTRLQLANKYTERLKLDWISENFIICFI